MWSCPSPAGPTGSSSAACPTRRRAAAACPGRAGAAGRPRRRSTSGAAPRRAGRPAPRLRTDRSLFAQDVRPLRRLEAEFRRIDAGIALQLAEAQRRGMAEVVQQLRRRDAVGAEAQAHQLEARVALFRPRLQPFHAVAAARVAQLEGLLHVARAGEQRGGRGAERARELAHRHLVEVAVVDPYALAVADDQLVHRLGIGPAEAPGPLEHEAAGGFLRQLAVAAVDLLLELGARRLRIAQEGLEALEAVGMRGRSQKQQAEKRRKKQMLHEAKLTPPWPGPIPRDCRWTASPRPCRRAPCPRSGGRRGCSRCAGGAGPARSRDAACAARSPPPDRTAGPSPPSARRKNRLRGPRRPPAPAPRPGTRAWPGLSGAPPPCAPRGRRRTRRARAAAVRCRAAGTACRRSRAAPRRPTGRGWCASRLSTTPGRRCASECWP